MTPFLIAVAGGSGSGKSSFCRAFARSLRRPALTIEQDAYYKDLSHLPKSEREQVNFDHPDSLDLDLLAAQLQQLHRGEAVDVPRYDFSEHTRLPDTRRVLPCPVILVEGILVLSVPEIRAAVDLCVFIDTPGDTAEQRRLVRDQRDRGRTQAQVEAQLAATVRPMFERFVLPTRAHADLILPGDGEMMDNVQRLRELALARGLRLD